MVAARSMRRMALVAAPLVVLGSCAPRCTPSTPVPEPTSTTTTTAVWPSPGDFTVSYDGAGPSAPRIGLVGDSTLAAIRWSGAYEPLRRWNYTFDAEACRRTSTTSCHLADGYAPENGLEVMARLRGQLGSVLVVMLGANDAANRFGEGIDAVLAEARAQGITRVIWLTVPHADDHNAILADRAQRSGGSLIVADWAAFVAPHPEWLYADGLHLSGPGAPVLAQFIADQVALVVPSG